MRQSCCFQAVKEYRSGRARCESTTRSPRASILPIVSDFDQSLRPSVRRFADECRKVIVLVDENTIVDQMLVQLKLSEDWIGWMQKRALANDGAGPTALAPSTPNFVATSASNHLQSCDNTKSPHHPILTPQQTPPKWYTRSQSYHKINID